MDASSLTLSIGPFPIERMSRYFFYLLLPCFIEIPVFNAKSVHPDQTPHSAASDLGLLFLPMSLLWDTRYKWINFNPFTSKFFDLNFLDWSIANRKFV